MLAQSYPHFEWILVNDGSTDETEAIIHEYNDKRIRYYIQENKGQCAASNFGLSVANGEYIKFFDADDLMNVNHIESLVGYVKDDDTLISCAWGRFYNNDFSSFNLEKEDVSKSLSSFEWLKTALNQRHDMMPGWLWLIPKKLLLKSGAWNPKYTLNNDFEFSVRLLLAAKQVVFCESAIIYYRTNIGSLSTELNKEKLQNAIESNLLAISYILKRENTDYTRLLCANRLQNWAYIVYPIYPDLFRHLKENILKLGGSNIKLEGGLKVKLFCLIFGWKITKRLVLYTR